MEIQFVTVELINETLTPMIAKKQWSKIRDYLNSFHQDGSNHVSQADGLEYCDEAIDSTLYLQHSPTDLKMSNYLTFNDLAGLVNATESLFFNEQSLVYNCLNFKHQDFIKNYHHFSHTEFSPTLFRDILNNNSKSKNKTHEKTHFLAIMNSLNYDKYAIEEDVFSVILKHKNYLQYALDSNVLNVNKMYDTKQPEIKTTLLHKTITYGSFESIEFLLSQYQWDLNIKRDDGIDLFYSAATHSHKAIAPKILDLLLKLYPSYDFSTTYYPSKDCEVHYISQYIENEPSYTLKQVLEGEIKNLKENNQYFDDYKEFYLTYYDSSLMVIEKHQLEKSVASSSDKKIKNKI